MELCKAYKTKLDEINKKKEVKSFNGADITVWLDGKQIGELQSISVGETRYKDLVGVHTNLSMSSMYYNTVRPVNPARGQTYFDISTNTRYVYDGFNWLRADRR